MFVCSFLLGKVHVCITMYEYVVEGNVFIVFLFISIGFVLMLLYLLYQGYIFTGSSSCFCNSFKKMYKSTVPNAPVLMIHYHLKCLQQC